MFLSPAECFIVGRLAVAWMSHSRTFEPLRDKAKMLVSVLNVLNRVFDEFGLDRPGPPKQWWDRADDIPGDVAWPKSTSVKRSKDYMPTDQGFAGTPAVAIGVSPSEPGTFFLERCDGRICGWRVELPRSGLYGLLIRRLRPQMGLSPQQWLMLHDGPWKKVAEDWRGLPVFDPAHPHTPCMPDPPADVVETLEAIGEEGGTRRPSASGRRRERSNTNSPWGSCWPTDSPVGRACTCTAGCTMPLSSGHVTADRDTLRVS